MHACIHVYVGVYLYMYSYTRIHIIYIYIYMYVCTYMKIHTYIRIHMHIDVHACIYRAHSCSACERRDSTGLRMLAALLQDVAMSSDDLLWVG